MCFGRNGQERVVNGAENQSGQTDEVSQPPDTGIKILRYAALRRGLSRLKKISKR